MNELLVDSNHQIKSPKKYSSFHEQLIKNKLTLNPSVNQNEDNEIEEKNSFITSSATKKLITVCCFCSCFIIIEFFGGLFCNSIAIMTDASHLLSDLSGFLISIYALYISKKKADNNFTFGYYRAEIIGAVASVFIIWVLTALLLAESISRIFDKARTVNGGIMLITSGIGLVFNAIMVYVLHFSGGEEEHHHCELHHQELNVLGNPEYFRSGHSYNEKEKKKKILMDEIRDNESDNFEIKIKTTSKSTFDILNGKNSSNRNKEPNLIKERKKPTKKDSYMLQTPLRDFEIIDSKEKTKKRKSDLTSQKFRKNFFSLMSEPHISRSLTRNYSKLHELDTFLGLNQREEMPSHSSLMNSQANQNINIKAALIHVIGDVIQSIGVIIAATLIYFFPNLQIIDPLMTILFSVIVVFTTVPIIKQAIYAVMEGNQSESKLIEIKTAILNTTGVSNINCAHLYYLSSEKAMLCAKVKIGKKDDSEEVLGRIYENLSKFFIFHCVIEVSKSNSFCSCLYI